MAHMADYEIMASLLYCIEYSTCLMVLSTKYNHFLCSDGTLVHRLSVLGVSVNAFSDALRHSSSIGSA